MSRRGCARGLLKWANKQLTVINQLIILNAMSTVAIITGATRNLGLALAQGLADRLKPSDVVYLTGQNAGRVSEALERISTGKAEVRGEALDVSDRTAVEHFAAALNQRHGGIDIVFSNHYTRVQPDDAPAEVIDHYVDVNNLGTTHVLRNFTPLLRDGGRMLVVASRAGSLRALAPVLHSRFEDVQSLDDVDAAVCAWRDAVREGRAAAEAWPAWMNIPSKIGQVAAVRVLARQRQADDLRRGILIAAICPGLIDTGASRPWFADMSRAQTPAQAAGHLIDLALDPAPDPAFYGELVQFGKVVPWKM